MDLIGAIIGMSAVGVNLVAFTHALPGTPARRLGLAAIGGAWVGILSLATNYQPLPGIRVLARIRSVRSGAPAKWLGRGRVAQVLTTSPPGAGGDDRTTAAGS